MAHSWFPVLLFTTCECIYVTSFGDKTSPSELGRSFCTSCAVLMLGGWPEAALENFPLTSSCWQNPVPPRLGVCSVLKIQLIHHGEEKCHSKRWENSCTLFDTCDTKYWEQYPPENYHDNGKSTMWRSISYSKWWVFQCHVSFQGCNIHSISKTPG